MKRYTQKQKRQHALKPIEVVPNPTSPLQAYPRELGKRALSRFYPTAILVRIRFQDVEHGHWADHKSYANLGQPLVIKRGKLENTPFGLMLSALETSIFVGFCIVSFDHQKVRD